MQSSISNPRKLRSTLGSDFLAAARHGFEVFFSDKPPVVIDPHSHRRPWGILLAEFVELIDQHILSARARLVDLSNVQYTRQFEVDA